MPAVRPRVRLEHAVVGGGPVEAGFGGDAQALRRRPSPPKATGRWASRRSVRRRKSRARSSCVRASPRIAEARAAAARTGARRRRCWNRRAAAESDGRTAWWRSRSGRARRTPCRPGRRVPRISGCLRADQRLVVEGEVAALAERARGLRDRCARNSSSNQASCESTCRSRKRLGREQARRALGVAVRGLPGLVELAVARDSE